jgi:hypothetical protein
MEDNNSNHRPKTLADTLGKTTTKTRYTKSESVKILEQLALQNLKKKYPTNPYLPVPKYTDATTNKLTKCIFDYIFLNGFQAKLHKSKGFFKDTRKIETDVLGFRRSVGSIQFVKTNPEKDFHQISTTIKGLNIKILAKCDPKKSQNQDNASVGALKQIDSPEGLFLIVQNFEQFYNWFNLFTKD